MDDFDLDLALEPGTITWEKQHQMSTLDLVLLSLSLTEKSDTMCYKCRMAI